jgi:signal transduction histidine kinase
LGETLFQELKRYVQWSSADEDALRALHPIAEPLFPRVAHVFYDAILNHEEARKSLVGGEQQAGHLKITLQGWMDRLLRGPWDEEYFEARCRIGRMHVRIDLPQHYMFGGMNVLRRELNDIIDGAYLRSPGDLALARRAVGRILDLELAIMLHTFREDLLARQARTERLATFGQLVGSIGHDLRNPLGVIETSLYILRRHAGEDERSRKHLDRIGDQVAVANNIIGNLLDMIRDRPLARDRIALGDVIAGAADSLEVPPEVSVERSGLDGVEVTGDPTQLRQVFVNLLDNAVQAVSPQGAVYVRAARRDGSVEVAVEDTGPGVDRATERRLFEPLITTKPRGIGLGLAIVKRIVERHGGTVSYDRGARGGAQFTVRLPASGSAGAAIPDR